MIIKYNARGEVEWAQGIGGSGKDEIYSVSACRDGGYVIGGYFRGQIDLGNNQSLIGNIFVGNGRNSGMIIKYSSGGTVEWASEISGDTDVEITTAIETSDGGYIVGGNFGEGTIYLNNGTSLTCKGEYSYYNDGMIIKYSSSKTEEWATSIGGKKNESIFSIVAPRKRYILWSSSPTTQIFLYLSARSEVKTYCAWFVSWYSSTIT